MSQPKQQIGLLSAVAIGLASMLGAGVFVVFHTAFALSPSGYYWALGLAALVAALNSWSIYSLARAVDRPGGVYAYSRIYLNDGFSFASGFAFVFGKIGSIAAIALAFNSYVLSEHPIWPAVGAVLLLTLVNILGIQRTAAVASVLAVTSTVFFAFMASEGLFRQAPVLVLPMPNAPLGTSVFAAAAVFFFAFAGYARVATLGNEVRDAKSNIPKAIVISLSIVMVLYAALAFVMLKFLGLDLLTATAPFKNLAEFFIPVIPHQVTIVVATLASLGSMLALLAGVSRTAASMGEDRELPTFFQLRNRFGSPWVAEVIIAAGAIALVAVGDLTWVIGFSSFSVLFYYSIGHLSVLRQRGDERIAPRAVAVVGFLLCWLLALQVQGPAVPVSLAIIALALLVRAEVVRRRSGRRYGGNPAASMMGAVNEIFHPNAHSAQLVLDEKREARLAMPSPTDKFGSVTRLVVYGTLGPGKPNHHVVADIPGTWSVGSVRGLLTNKGWGADQGFPGIVLDEGAPEVMADVLESSELAAHLDRLDEFEGPGYRRVVTKVQTTTGQFDAYIYEVKP